MLKHKFLMFSIIVSVIYLVPCTLAFIFFITRHETDKFAAMFIALLTLPWSFCFVLFKDLIIAPFYNYEFNFITNTITLLISVFFNTFLIFFIPYKIRKIWERSQLEPLDKA